MRLSLVTTIVASFLLFANHVGASCTASNATCQEGSGDCTRAIRLVLRGDQALAGNSVFYGKYCGKLNKCQVVKDGSASSEDDEVLDEASVCEIQSPRHNRLKGKTKKGKKFETKKNKKKSGDDGNVKPCPALPCDDIDASCSAHDTCLDNEALSSPLKDGGSLQIPQRCVCDVNFIFDMAIQATINPEITGLCDAAFYTDPIAENLLVTGIELMEHEAIFVAAPFCCDILRDVDGNGIAECDEDPNTDNNRFFLAAAMCKHVLDNLAELGIRC